MSRVATRRRSPLAIPQAALTGLERIGTRIDLHACVDSTNTTAFEAAAAGAPDGTVIVADAQRAGRGRLGRSWRSPAGRNLYLSILLRTPLPREVVATLPFLAAVALRDAIRDVTGLEAATKWPNDITIGGRKVGGILVEARGRGSRTMFAVAGIGVNVNWPRRTMPANLQATATSLQDERGRAVSRPRLLVTLLNRFDDGYERLHRHGSAPLLADWSRTCLTLHRTVDAQTPTEPIMGPAVSIDPARAGLCCSIQAAQPAPSPPTRSCTCGRPERQQ